MLNLHLLECTLKGYGHISDLLLAKYWVITGCKYYRCKKLKEITLPENLTILKDAFSFSGITEIIIPGRITELNDNIFYGCYDLKNITLPDSVS